METGEWRPSSDCILHHADHALHCIGLTVKWGQPDSFYSLLFNVSITRTDLIKFYIFKWDRDIEYGLELERGLKGVVSSDGWLFKNHDARCSGTITGGID